ncbi:protein Sia1p [Diutina catenulata]
MGSIRVNPFFRRVLMVAALAAGLASLYSWLHLFTIARVAPLGSVLDTYPHYDNLMGTVVTDVRVMSCVQTSCAPPHGYNKSTALNLFDPANIRSRNFYLVTRHQPVAEAARVLVDLRFAPFGDDEPHYEYDSEKVASVTVYKKYAVGDAITSASVARVHGVDVLYGADDFQDFRPHHQVVRVPAFGREVPEGVRPVLSMLRMSPEQGTAFDASYREFMARRERSEILAAGSKFKVLQVSDTHFGMDAGPCDGEACRSDLRTLRFLEKSLDAEKPALVVITGDLFDLDRSPDYKSVLIKSLHPVLKRQIPFVYTFGDSEYTHDARTRRIKRSVVNFLQTLPNCYNSDPADGDVHGVTNYNLQVVVDGQAQAMVTVLDTEDHGLEVSQMHFLYKESRKHPHAKYKMLFFHYPLPQYRPKGKFKIVGSYEEKGDLGSNTSPKFYDDIVDNGYQVVSVGHEHENDACIMTDNKMWMCFNAVTGDSAKTTTAEFARRLRVFEIDFEKEQMLSWKRKENEDKPYDPQRIVPLE